MEIVDEELKLHGYRQKKKLAGSGLRLYLSIEYIHQCLVLYFFFLMIPQIRSGN